ncbi:hypothetical protein RCR19_43160 (plasmid) [Streptomyces sp. WAC07094]|uniref:hypothetical protein n=1 Tax=Streptomyces sp. WAC07094 TaxID=3072183 RepID=UPI002ECD199C|nr:hypothetical protein [Streptomyces sp. WAC07094]
MSASTASAANPATSRLVPYITSRVSEHPDLLLSLRVQRGPHGHLQLGYWDELTEDRDLRDVLWGRCSQTIGADGLPTGRPSWRMVHPSRQRECMQQLRCQVCALSARTRHGIIFLAGPDEARPQEAVVRTAQPPVCLRHARTSAEQCPHLDGRPTVFLAQSAPLYGVIGTPYQYSDDGLQAISATDEALPYGHPDLRWFLASQMVRRLRAYTVITLDDLPDH